MGTVIGRVDFSTDETTEEKTKKGKGTKVDTPEVGADETTEEKTEEQGG